MLTRIAALAAVACALASLAAAQTVSGNGPPVVNAGVAAPTATASPPDERLEGKRLYIYSFLDVREMQFTPPVLAEIDRQLMTSLASAGVPATELHFKDSIPGSSFAQTTNAPGRSSEMIPVGATIASNLSQERASDATYRLIVFPANFETVGAWEYFDVRWTLVDCHTGAQLWIYHYDGKTLIWWRNSERAESRAKAIVDDFMSRLRSDGYL